MTDVATVLADVQKALADATAAGAPGVVAALNVVVGDLGAMSSAPALPSWVPPPGYYADIPAVNTPSQAIAAEVPYYSAFADGVFSNWSGGFYAADFSPLGAMVYEGGGHSSNPTAFSATEHDGKLVFDLSTLTWHTRNYPTQYYAESGTSDAYGQRPDGSVYSPHTYHGNQDFPASWGGGAQGGSFRAGFAGAQLYNSAWVTDLSQPKLGWTKLVPVLTVEAGTFATKSAYLETAIDRQRLGWWVATHMASDRILFVTKDGTVSTYMGAGINSNGSAFTRDPTRDVLVRVDVIDATAALQVHELDCANPSAGWKSKPLTPDPLTIADRTQLPLYMPNPNSPSMLRNDFARCGLEWSTILGAFVQFQDGVPNASAVTSMPYVWVISYAAASDSYTIRRETLTAAQGTGPTSYAAAAGGAPIYNGTYNKFREVPAAHCFVWATSGTQRPQAFRLLGM